MPSRRPDSSTRPVANRPVGADPTTGCAAAAGGPEPAPATTTAPIGALQPAPAIGDPPDRTDPLPLPEFQEAGARRARRILDRYRGVLIADPTGSGKTFIALSLIEHAIASGLGPVLVSGPAALRTHWLRHLRSISNGQPLHQADLTGSVEPAGPGLASNRKSTEPPVVGWTSHTALSLGRWPVSLDSPALVVVDEAHAFRNPRTRRYRALARLCRSARVVLLTATPVHNSLLDLYFQLRLFLSDEGLAHLGVPDMRSAFMRAAAAPGPVPESLRSGIDRVCIRRSRKEIEAWIDKVLGPAESGRPAGDTPGNGAGRAMSRPPLRFPIREPPRVVAWGRPGAGFRRECAVLEALELTPFGLGAGAGTGAELMRFHLLKRLESSEAAFRDSLTRLIRFLVSFLEALDQGFLLRPDDRRAMTRGASDAQLFLAPLTLQPLPVRHDRRLLADSVARDLDALRGLAECTHPPGGVDPKVAALDRLLCGPLADTPVLVFSEFRATAVELWRRLSGRHRVGLIHGGGAWLGSSRASRAEVVRAFAPRSNHAPIRAVSRIRVLFATDVLSEGWNLQDARDVVSFDLPWNPVRLIQRLGRIDRLGSPHPTVRCHNFMPDHDLDDILGLVERLTAKLDAIRAAGGHPGRVLLRGRVRHDHAGVEADARGGNAGAAPLGLPASRTCSAAHRLRARLLRLLVREPGGAGAPLCERADRVLQFLAEPQRIGVELELQTLEARMRTATAAPSPPIRAAAPARHEVGPGGAAGLLDGLEAILPPQ